MPLARPLFTISSSEELARWLAQLVRHRSVYRRTRDETPRGLAVRRTQPGLTFSDATEVDTIELVALPNDNTWNAMHVLRTGYFSSDFAAISWRYYGDSFLILSVATSNLYVVV